MSDFYSNMYNPDVLTCLANLSNDEVFTPPEVANRMLDMLPEELWHDSSATFLDPACKSGVFLREIAKRLIEGLKEEIPDLQERIDHIFHKQLYGIAITELTSLLSRRSVYCSKYPNSKYSITLFEDTSGNIRYKRIARGFLPDVLGFAAVPCFPQITTSLTPEFAQLDGKARGQAHELCLVLSRYLLLERERWDTMEDAVQAIGAVTQIYLDCLE